MERLKKIYCELLLVLMEEISWDSLSWGNSELIDVKMPDGSIEPAMVLYNVRGLPEGIQGFTAYRGNPIFPKYDVIGINEHLTYPNVKDKLGYVVKHEKIHKHNKKRPLMRAFGPALEEYMTRVAADEAHEAKTGEHVDTAGDMLKDIAG